MRDILDKLKQINEGHLGMMADRVELDHEVQMARADLYKIAKYSIKLHEMLKGVSEIQGIEGWQQAKITKAADYLSSVYHNMDYEMSPMNPENAEAEQMDDMAFDLASESKETVKESRMGYSDAEKLGSAAASKIDNVLRRKIYDMGKDIRDIEPGTLDRMRYQVAKELGLVESIEIDEAKADPKIVARFAKVRPSQRSYYIMQWAKEEGIDSDKAMEMAGYVKGDYMGAGAYRWKYVGEGQVDEAGYTEPQLKAMDDLVKSVNDKDSDDPGMERDSTQGLDPEFSKRVADQNKKNMSELPKSKFSDWSKK